MCISPTASLVVDLEVVGMMAVDVDTDASDSTSGHSPKFHCIGEWDHSCKFAGWFSPRVPSNRAMLIHLAHASMLFEPLRTLANEPPEAHLRVSHQVCGLNYKFQVNLCVILIVIDVMLAAC